MYDNEHKLGMTVINKKRSVNYRHMLAQIVNMDDKEDNYVVALMDRCQISICITFPSFSRCISGVQMPRQDSQFARNYAQGTVVKKPLAVAC